ncbi:MAG: hypothetical protein M3307_02940, partial [Thermoproteota archaeon]|nr:hypothetical protein [Thermoproteota archaeon]
MKKKKRGPYNLHAEVNLCQFVVATGFSYFLNCLTIWFALEAGYQEGQHSILAPNYVTIMSLIGDT